MLTILHMKKKLLIIALQISFTASLFAIESVNTFFANSNSDVFHDQSSMFLWGTTTLSYYEYPANPEWGKKIVCTSSGYSGNAINLTWSIANGGGFGVNIYKNDWSSVDVTSTTYLSYWVLSPFGITKNYLPRLKIISSDNSAGNEIASENYFASDLTANVWYEVRVPLSSLKGSLSSGQLSLINDVQLINIIDDGGISHTLYIDNINFITVTPSVTVNYLDQNSNVIQTSRVQTSSLVIGNTYTATNTDKNDILLNGVNYSYDPTSIDNATVIFGNINVNLKFIANYVSVSGNSGNWNNPTMWQEGSVPSAGANITVNNNISINQNTSINTLTVSPNGKVTLNSGTTLNTFTLNLNSDENGTGTYLDNGTSVINTANVQQYLTSGRNWYISTPISTAKPTALSTANSIVFYNESTAQWLSPETNSQLAVGKGYISVATNTTGSITFTGTLNTGTISVPLTRTNGISKTGFNLVGNPYPSYLDWSKVDTTSANLTSTIWYRTKTAPDADLNTAYVFDTYNGMANVGTSNGATAVTKLIPPMQAFWVRVKSGYSSGTLTFNNDMRSHRDNANNKFKAPSVQNSMQKLLRLEVSNGINSDEAILLFNPNASDGYDAYDSPKMSNGNVSIPEIYTMVGTEQLVINGLNNIVTNTEIPLGFTTGQSNLFSIKATQMSNFDINDKIYLRDNLLNTEKELTETSAYSFTSDVTSSNSRFSIILKFAGVTTNLNNSNDEQDVLIYDNANNQIVVNIKGDIPSQAYVSVCNALGQILFKTPTTGTQTIITKKFNAGIFFVSVSAFGKCYSKKLVIEN